MRCAGGGFSAGPEKKPRSELETAHLSSGDPSAYEGGSRSAAKAPGIADNYHQNAEALRSSGQKLDTQYATQEAALKREGDIPAVSRATKGTVQQAIQDNQATLEGSQQAFTNKYEKMEQALNQQIRQGAEKNALQNMGRLHKNLTKEESDV